MINRGNYDSIINGFGIENLDPILKASHENYLEIQEFYSEDEDVRQTIDLYFRKLERYINKFKEEQLKKIEKKPIDKVSPSDSTFKEKKSITAEKTVKAKRKENTKIDIKKKAKEIIQNAKRVHNITEDRKFIKRFVGFHSRVKTRSSILNFIKALQKAILQKLISKKSPFVKEIRGIQERMVAFYNKMDHENLFIIPDKDLIKLVSIAGGEQVFKSIEVIRSFIGLQGKELEENKLKNFIKKIEGLLDKGKIGNDDPYQEKVKLILKTLRKLVPGKDSVNLSKVELSGLEGIVKGCACSNLGKIYNTKGKSLRKCKSRNYSDAKKGACSHNKGLDGGMTAEEIANMTFDLLPFSGHWAELIGKPEKNFSLMIHGEPGAGKSTFLIKFAKYLTAFGNVLYVASEEFGSVTLKNLVTTYLNPIPANLVFVPNLDATNVGDYDFVIFDSINDAGLKLDDYKAMKLENPKTAFILVLQHTKDGQFKGGKEWEHDSQIVGKIDNGVIEIYKNRYGQKGNMNFFES